MANAAVGHVGRIRGVKNLSIVFIMTAGEVMRVVDAMNYAHEAVFETPNHIEPDTVLILMARLAL